MVDKAQIWQALKHVTYPGTKQSVIGMVQDLSVEDERVALALGIAHLAAEPKQALIDTVRQTIEAIEGAESVEVQAVPRATQPTSPAPAPQDRRAAIRHVIAVGSGKGGVGKSTISVNLALALAQQGLRVGLMDADIFGPNVPRMLGVEALPPKRGNEIIPAEVHGLKVVSIGLLVDPDKAVVWRGPMTDKLIAQFTRQVAWGELDVLVVDLPPGTGDIALSLAKHARPDGAIAVVTPQAVASDDARKAIGMFRRLEIPVLGVVENMSYFDCPDCGSRHHLFGEGGGQQLAASLDIALLGQVPFEPVVREGGDQGQPAILADSEAGTALKAVAENVRVQLQEEAWSEPG